MNKPIGGFLLSSLKIKIDMRLKDRRSTKLHKGETDEFLVVRLDRAVFLISLKSGGYSVTHNKNEKRKHQKSFFTNELLLLKLITGE